jgi:transcriptional regulator with XRE-family HTH domain
MEKFGLVFSAMDSIWDEAKFKVARKGAKLTAKTAGERLNVTPEYVYMLEGGKKRPSQDLVDRMAEVYQLPIAYFLKNETSGAAV